MGLAHEPHERAERSTTVVKMATRTIGAALPLVVALLVAGCATHPVVSTAADGLRTFAVIRNADGSSPPCAAFGLGDPVSGILRGQAGAPEPVWLETGDGRRLSVVWPEGFTVRFEPEAVVMSDRGTVVGRAGDRITLDQTRPSDAAGTFADPYLASGLVFGDCYLAVVR